MEPLQIEISCTQCKDKLSPIIEVIESRAGGSDIRKSIPIPRDLYKEFDTLKEAEEYGKSLVPELVKAVYEKSVEYVMRTTHDVDGTRASALPPI